MLEYDHYFRMKRLTSFYMLEYDHYFRMKRLSTFYMLEYDHYFRMERLSSFYMLEYDHYFRMMRLSKERITLWLLTFILLAFIQLIEAESKYVRASPASLCCVLEQEH